MDELAREGARTTGVTDDPKAVDHKSMLIDLHDRLAAAAGPNFDLDCKIEHLFEPKRAQQIGNPRPYTASIDAAVTLVPEGIQWDLIGGGHPGEEAYVALSHEGDVYLNDAQALTPALAICQAAVAYHLSILGDYPAIAKAEAK